MSEMIDRVAKALCIANGHNLEQQAPDNGDPVDMKMWETFKSFARLAIETMKNPDVRVAHYPGDPLYKDGFWDLMIDKMLKTSE